MALLNAFSFFFFFTFSIEVVSGVASESANTAITSACMPQTLAPAGTCLEMSVLANSPNRWQRQCHSSMSGLSWVCQGSSSHPWPYTHAQLHYKVLEGRRALHHEGPGSLQLLGQVQLRPLVGLMWMKMNTDKCIVGVGKSYFLTCDQASLASLVFWCMTV